jgi:hypothetical protein
MNTNGTANDHGTGGKLLWWLIGGILTPLIITTFNTLTADSKRVTALEAVVQEINHRLERMDNKLEKLLERRP